MRFVIAGGGAAGLSAALGVARAGHRAVVLERDDVEAQDAPDGAFEEPRHGIPHFLQPHAFLPRGRQVLRRWAPDVHDALLDAGAEPQDLTEGLHGPPEPGDEDLVYLWARRPVIEWALRRAAARQRGVELRPGAQVGRLLRDERGRAAGVGLTGGEAVRGDVVVDALGRYRPPAGWPRAAGSPVDSGAVYYSRYFALRDGEEHTDAPLLNPRGDLGYMGFNVFRGDNRTFAVVVQTPSADHGLRVLRRESAWMRACAAIRPLDAMTSPDHATPVTGVLPMGGLMNVDRTGDPGVGRLVAIGDALCHTDPGFAYGLSFSLAQGEALGAVADEPADDVADALRAAVGDELRERHDLACATDAARARRWAGETLPIGRRDGCYPLFAFAAALAAAPHDDRVLRRTVRRIGLLDRLAAFDADADVHDRIEATFARLMRAPPPSPGPPRDELLARLAGVPR